MVHEDSLVKIDDDLPLDKAALVGCGVTTGVGTAVYGAEVKAGDTVVVMGVGGVGANAVQGARMAGAARIIAIDPAPFNREMAGKFGATHMYASAAEALEPIEEMTRGAMANATLVTVDLTTAKVIADAVSMEEEREVGRIGCLGATSRAHHLSAPVLDEWCTERRGLSRQRTVPRRRPGPSRAARGPARVRRSRRQTSSTGETTCGRAHRSWPCA